MTEYQTLVVNAEIAKVRAMLGRELNAAEIKAVTEYVTNNMLMQASGSALVH